MFLHILLLYTVTGLSGKDNDLAHNICSAKVDTWIWLRVAILFGGKHGLGERTIGRDLVEDEVERSAQYSLNLQNAVTGVAQIIDRTNDGQSCADIGLKEELDAATQRRFFQMRVIIVSRACRNLISSDNTDIVVQ